MNVDQADVAFSALDAADVRTVEIARECERLLRKPFLLSEFSHTFTEALLNLSVTSLHPATMESPEMTMSPRTLRILSERAVCLRILSPTGVAQPLRFAPGLEPPGRSGPPPGEPDTSSCADARP